jgi:hypothetical protein
MDNTIGSPTTPRTSGAAKVALAAAIGGIIATFAGHQGWGLFAGIAAIVFGAIGFLVSISPRVRGGPMSGFAVIIGVVGLVLALIGIVFGVLI